MKNQLYNIKNEAISLILDAHSLPDLEEIKLQFLGRSGTFTLALKELSKLPKEEKPEIGRVANEVKTIIEETLQQKQEQLFQTKRTQQIQFDVTDPGLRPPL